MKRKSKPRTVHAVDLGELDGPIKKIAKVQMRTISGTIRYLITQGLAAELARHSSISKPHAGQ